ncbi:hypothetical protein [Candidatus Spongiihabitans sp.]|uniref:hypothetical protein n=1 Tax=Candidatus Spongiihabitans sp. TaxID=3101308 RepID=UPI003C797295
MTIAEIHGKISGSGSNISDRLEDLLTSDVFGPLRYLPSCEGLLPVLCQAQLYSGSRKKLEVSFVRGEPEVCFWPRMECSEPDVLIKYDDHLLMIEAKYLSGKSGSYDEDADEPTTSDQLAREFQDLMEYEGDFKKRSLIYLTAHRTMPKDDLTISYNRICKEYKKRYQENTYWLSWVDVRKTIKNCCEKNKDLDPHKKLILEDIERLLHRKGMRGFEGFRGLDIQKVDRVSGVIFYERGMGFSGLKLNEVNIVPGTIFYQQNA